MTPPPSFQAPTHGMERGAALALPRLGLRGYSASIAVSKELPAPMKVSLGSLASLQSCRDSLTRSSGPDAGAIAQMGSPEEVQCHLPARYCTQASRGATAEAVFLSTGALGAAIPSIDLACWPAHRPSIEMHSAQSSIREIAASTSMQRAVLADAQPSPQDIAAPSTSRPAAGLTQMQVTAGSMSGVVVADVARPPGMVSADGKNMMPPPASRADMQFPLLRAARDPNRHAVLLKLMESGSVEERSSLAQQLAGSVLSLSYDKSGCWVIQKAMEVMPKHLQVGLALELRGHVVECVEHMHGNFVIQKMVEQLPSAMLGFVVEEVEGKVEELAQHIYGCRTVQRLFEHCSLKQLQGMLHRLLQYVERLAQDQFGNNVVRHLLEHGGEKEIRHIIQAMSGNIQEHANHKSSSLVLEKCLQAATHGEHAACLEAERAALVRAVLAPGVAQTTMSAWKRPLLEDIMLNRFGNYLVQRVIECSRGEERDILRQRLKVAEPQLRRSATGKHILAAARRELGQRRSQG